MNRPMEVRPARKGWSARKGWTIAFVLLFLAVLYFLVIFRGLNSRLLSQNKELIKVNQQLANKLAVKDSLLVAQSAEINLLRQLGSPQPVDLSGLEREISALRRQGAGADWLRRRNGELEDENSRLRTQLSALENQPKPPTRDYLTYNNGSGGDKRLVFLKNGEQYQHPELFYGRSGTAEVKYYMSSAGVVLDVIQDGSPEPVIVTGKYDMHNIDNELTGQICSFDVRNYGDIVGARVLIEASGNFDKVGIRMSKTKNYYTTKGFCSFKIEAVDVGDGANIILYAGENDRNNPNFKVQVTIRWD